MQVNSTVFGTLPSSCYQGHLATLAGALRDNPNNNCKGVFSGLIVQMITMLLWQHDQIYKIGV